MSRHEPMSQAPRHAGRLVEQYGIFNPFRRIRLLYWFGFRDEDFRVWGLGFRVWGLGCSSSRSRAGKRRHAHPKAAQALLKTKPEPAEPEPAKPIFHLQKTLCFGGM